MARSDGRFRGLDGAPLVGAQRKAIAESFPSQQRLGLVQVLPRQSLEPLRRIPAIQGAGKVFGAAQIPKPDATAGTQLAQIGPAVTGEGKG